MVVGSVITLIHVLKEHISYIWRIINEASPLQSSAKSVIDPQIYLNNSF
jgi:hypothetical protein